MTFWVPWNATIVIGSRGRSLLSREAKMQRRDRLPGYCEGFRWFEAALSDLSVVYIRAQIRDSILKILRISVPCQHHTVHHPRETNPYTRG